MKVLVINAGSSSLKYQLIDVDKNDVIAKGLCERIGINDSKLTYKPKGKEPYELVQDMKDHTDAIKLVLNMLVDKNRGVLSSMDEIDAVGHRIVHGGERFAESVLITDEVIDEIKSLSALAPLHNPANLMGINACKAVMPKTPMVAVFDTAFHQTMPEKAFMYGLPYEAYTQLKIRRYGFHGTSHAYVSRRALSYLEMPVEQTKIITCHLGNGSSVTAVRGGKCVDTSMGFTPLAGVAMGTRCGDMDPAIVTYLMEKLNLDRKGVDAYMNKKSGMLGISGKSSDFRDFGDAAKQGDSRSKLALETFAYQVKRFIGAYAAVMNGVDAIVFTAGVGENDRAMRQSIMDGLDYLGVEFDNEFNMTCPRGQEVVISKPTSRVKVIVIPTDEEMMIALDTARLVS